MTMTHSGTLIWQYGQGVTLSVYPNDTFGARRGPKGSWPSTTRELRHFCQEPAVFGTCQREPTARTRIPEGVSFIPQVCKLVAKRWQDFG